MKISRMIELSDDDTIIGSIVENGEVTALLKVTNTGQPYFEAKKDSILPVFIENFGQFFENSKKQIVSKSVILL